MAKGADLFNLAIKRTVFARLYLPDRQIKLKEQSIMVIILKQNQEKAKVDELIHWLENFQVQVNVVNGSHTTILDYRRYFQNRHRKCCRQGCGWKCKTSTGALQKRQPKIFTLMTRSLMWKDEKSARDTWMSLRVPARWIRGTNLRNWPDGKSGGASFLRGVHSSRELPHLRFPRAARGRNWAFNRSQS